MKPAVFLDRDNTLIHNDGDLGDPDQVRLMQGAASAVGSLCGLGYRVVVVSNQGGVARGAYDEAAVDRVNERLRELIRQHSNGAVVDRFYYCPYHPEGTVDAYKREHPNRKPQPGMLLEAARDLDLDLARSWMIGDQMRDVEAGVRAGCRTILLQPKAAPGDRLEAEAFQTTGSDGDPIRPDHVARSLIEAVRFVAQARKPESQEPPKATSKPEPADDPPAAEPDPPKARTASRSKKKSKARTTSTKKPPASDEPSAPAEPDPAPTTAAPEPDEPAPDPAPADAQDEPPASPAPTTPPTPTTPHTPQHIALARPTRTGELDGVHQTLRQVLQELRHQRTLRHEWTHTAIVALILQIIAAICLLGGLWMAGDDGQLLLRWMAAALFLQLTTIAALLFDQR